TSLGFHVLSNSLSSVSFFIFFNAPTTTEIYTLSLHDALPILDKICDGEEITMQDVDEVYHKKLAATKEEIYEACQGFITEHHVYMLQIIRQEIAGTQQTIESLTQRIKEVLSPYENALELLTKVPGISSKSVEDLVAEIGL